MRVELKDQTDIIRSIRAQGGHARKWASGWQMGMPDIVGCFPTTGPFLMEVKAIDNPKSGSPIVPKLEVTDKQRLELRAFSNAGFLCCIGVVVHKKPKVLLIEEWWAEQLGDGRAFGPIMTEWEDKQYNVLGVMHRYRRNHNDEAKRDR